MKTCTKCRRELSEAQFSRHRGRPDGLQLHCKPCQRETQQTRYYANLDAERARAVVASKRWRDRHPEKVAEQNRAAYAAGVWRRPKYAAGRTRYEQAKRDLIKAEKLRRGGCADCGLTVTDINYVGFDFDHDDRSTKLKAVASICGHELLVAEMAKCTLRCAVCHRVRTHQGGHWVSLSRGEGVAAPSNAVEQLDLFGEVG